jgi:hypothetical protein
LVVIYGGMRFAALGLFPKTKCRFVIFPHRTFKGFSYRETENQNRQNKVLPAQHKGKSGLASRPPKS